jgi:hypothetical protein
VVVFLFYGLIQKGSATGGIQMVTKVVVATGTLAWATLLAECWISAGYRLVRASNLGNEQFEMEFNK